MVNNYHARGRQRDSTMCTTINCERGCNTLNPSSLVVHPRLILDAILLNKVFEFEFQFLMNVGDHDMACNSIISE